MVWPAIIAAGASLAGGAMGMRSAGAAARMQDHYINNAIGIRVADARRQGIHPLAALGVGNIAGQVVSPSNAMGEALASAGQDVSRAMYQEQAQADREAAARQSFRQSELNDKLAKIGVMRAEEELVQARLRTQAMNRDANREEAADLMRAQLNQSRNGSQVGPGVVKESAAEQVSRDPRFHGQEAHRGGGSPAMKKWKIGHGSTGISMEIPKEEFTEGLEGLGPLGWMLGAGAVGAHYNSKFWNWLKEQSPRPGFKRVYRDGRIVEVPK